MWPRLSPIILDRIRKVRVTDKQLCTMMECLKYDAEITPTPGEWRYVMLYEEYWFVFLMQQQGCAGFRFTFGSGRIWYYRIRPELYRIWAIPDPNLPNWLYHCRFSALLSMASALPMVAPYTLTAVISWTSHLALWMVLLTNIHQSHVSWSTNYSHCFHGHKSGSGSGRKCRIRHIPMYCTWT